MKKIKIIQADYVNEGEHDLYENSAEIKSAFPNASEFYDEKHPAMLAALSCDDFIGFVTSSKHTDEEPNLVPIFEECDEYEILE